MLFEIILGAAGDAALAYAGSKGSDLFKSAKAKREIAEIGARSIEVGIAKVPALANDLRSESFAKGVFVPVLKTLIVDPSKFWTGNRGQTRPIRSILMMHEKTRKPDRMSG